MKLDTVIHTYLQVSTNLILDALMHLLTLYFLFLRFRRQLQGFEQPLMCQALPGRTTPSLHTSNTAKALVQGQPGIAQGTARSSLASRKSMTGINGRAAKSHMQTSLSDTLKSHFT